MLISTNSGLHSGVPNAPRVSMIDAMDFFADAGFEAVDVNFSAITYEGNKHECILDGDWKANLDLLSAKMKERGLVVSHSHAPFFRYADTNPDDEKVRLTHLSIEAAAYIGAPWIVLHTEKGESVNVVPTTIEALKPYMETAHKYNIGIAVENNPFASADQLMEICDYFNNDHIGILWDVGHANLEPQYSSPEAIMKMGKTLKAVHLHDNYGMKDNHNSPYFGKLDWDAITHALLTSGYEGTFNFEVNCKNMPLAIRMEHAKYLVAVAKHLLEVNK